MSRKDEAIPRGFMAASLCMALGKAERTATPRASTNRSGGGGKNILKSGKQREKKFRLLHLPIQGKPVKRRSTSHIACQLL